MSLSPLILTRRGSPTSKGKLLCMHVKGTSAEVYFLFLPIATSSIEAAIDSIHQVIKPIPNGCDSRFEEMKDKMPQVIQEFAKTRHSLNKAKKGKRG